MVRWETLKTEFEAYLNTQKFDYSPGSLYEPMKYILKMGGKRVRPLLALLGAQLFEDEISQAYPIALAIEIFHNFSLLHDDIMDDAPLRRGKPTVHIKYGQNAAILTGDVMLVLAYEQISNSCTKENLGPILADFTKMAREVCEGQQMDMDFETAEKVTIQEYLEMIRLKTSVLVGASIKMGAAVMGASEKDQQKIYDFGVNIGIAFQLQDDILDTFGDPSRFGKQMGGDIIQGKKTFLYLKALEKAGSSLKAEIENTMLDETMNDLSKVDAIKGYFRSLNIESEAEQAKLQYQEKAMHLLSEVDVDEARKRNLRALSESLFLRKE